MKFSIGQKVDHNYHSGIWEILRLRMDEAGVSYDLVKKGEDRNVIDHLHGVPEHQLTAHVEHPPHRFKVGDRVKHKVAGTGTIVRLDGRSPTVGGGLTNQYLVCTDSGHFDCCWFEENIQQIPKWEAGDWLAYNFGGTDYIRKVVEARITGDGKEEIKFDTSTYFLPVPADACKVGVKPTFLSGTPVWTKDGKASGQVRSTLWINGVEEAHCVGEIGNLPADRLTSEEPVKLEPGDWVGYSYGKTASGLFQFVRKVVRVSILDVVEVEGERGGVLLSLPTGWAKMKMYPTFENGQRVWDRYGEELSVLHTYWYDGVEWVKFEGGRACKASDLSAKAPEARVKVGTAVKLKASGFYAMVVERVGTKYDLRFSDGSEMKNVLRNEFEPCPPITLRYRGGGTVTNDSGRPILAGEEYAIVVEPTIGFRPITWRLS